MALTMIERASRMAARPASRLLRAGFLACALFAALAGGALAAETYPTRAVKIVVPFAPGGGSDLQVRMLAERLAKVWNQPVVVDNVAGAGGGLAASQVARSRPDGYTILFATHPILSINPYLYEKLPYDPKDLLPVVELSESPNVLLVNSGSKFKSVADLIRQAKAAPGTLHFGSGGIGTSQQLTGELFRAAAGIDIVHVPYKGTSPATVALLANDIDLHFDSVYSAATQIKGGKVRGLAITSKSRNPMLPDVPTMEESGLKGFEVFLAYGLLVPVGTPPDVVAAINRAANQVLQDPGYREQMQSQGMTVRGGSGDDLRKLLDAESAKWRDLVKSLNIHLE